MWGRAETRSRRGPRVRAAQVRQAIGVCVLPRTACEVPGRTTQTDRLPRVPSLEDRPYRAFVIVNCLALVIIFRADRAAPRSDGLRRLLSLESPEQSLLARGGGSIAQAASAQHPGVVHLHVLGIDRADLRQHFDSARARSRDASAPSESPSAF